MTRNVSFILKRLNRECVHELHNAGKERKQDEGKTKLSKAGSKNGYWYATVVSEARSYCYAAVMKII